MKCIYCKDYSTYQVCNSCKIIKWYKKVVFEMGGEPIKIIKKKLY